VTKSYPWVSDRLADMMVQLAGVMRRAWTNNSVELPFSFRELQTWSVTLTENNGDIRAALMSVYGNLLTDKEKEVLDIAVRDVGL